MNQPLKALIHEMTIFLATFVLTSWMFPYHCKNCGERLSKLRFTDLPAEVQQKHLIAGTDWILNRYAYQCDHCSATAPEPVCYLVA